MGVLRSRIGDREDKFFATIFLGTGLQFVGMLFVSAAFAGGIASETSPAEAAPDAELPPRVAMGTCAVAIVEGNRASEAVTRC